MEISVVNFRIMFPEFSNIADYPDALIQFWLDFAACLVCLFDFAECAQEKAHGFLAAHYLKLAVDRANTENENVAAGSIVSSMAVGDVNISWDNSQVSSYASGLSRDAVSAELSLTDYGKIFLSMRKRLGFIATTTGLA